MPYRISVLGTSGLRGDEGQPVNSVLQQPRRFALLVYLALESRSGPVRRDTVLGVFWPDKTWDIARGSLNQALYYLRRSLGPDAIRTNADSVEVDGGIVTCDAVELLVASEEGRWLEAADLHGGELLPGYFDNGQSAEFEHWLEATRATIQAAAAKCAWKMAEVEEGGGNAPGAIVWARQACALSSGREAQVRSLMEMMARLGDRAGVLEAFGTLCRSLGELDATPAPATKELLARLRASWEEEDRKAPPAGYGSGEVRVPWTAEPQAKEDHGIGVTGPAPELAGAPTLGPPGGAPPRDPRRGSPQPPSQAGVGCGHLGSHDPHPLPLGRYPGTHLRGLDPDHRGHRRDGSPGGGRGGGPDAPWRGGEPVAGDDSPSGRGGGRQGGGGPGAWVRSPRQPAPDGRGVAGQRPPGGRRERHDPGQHQAGAATAELPGGLDEMARVVAQFARREVGAALAARRLVEAPFPERAITMVQLGRQDMALGASLWRDRSTEGAMAAYAKADSMFAEAAQLAPQWDLPWIDRAETAYRLMWIQRRSEAGSREAERDLVAQGIRFAGEAIARNDRQAESLELRALLYEWQWLLAQPDASGGSAELLARAEEDARRATELDPHRARAWNVLGATLLHRGAGPTPTGPWAGRWRRTPT
jgi:DNA-binding SARP family transcriptional activator